MSKYYFYMAKHLDLTEDRIKEVVDILGERTRLGEGLNISKALIENYFEGDEKAKEIIELIEKLKNEKSKNK